MTKKPKQYPEAWVFDINRRIYARDKNGRSYGSPIWREHWRKVEIVGETTRSWVLASGKKLPKAGGRGVCYSLDEIEKKAFVEDHAYRISALVDKTLDYDKLKKIAEIVGYKP